MSKRAPTGPAEKVTSLIVQTRWFPLYLEREDGSVSQRLVASEKDKDTLAREILASGAIRAVPEVSGPMPDLSAFTALRQLTVEDAITTPLPENLGETHPGLVALHLHEWKGDAARVPASLRGRPLRSLRLPPQATLASGLDFPKLEALKIPMRLLHEWRAEIPKLKELLELEITRDPSGIHELPAELASLPKLRMLDVSHLGLASLPELPATLEQLDVTDNRLTSLAPRFGPRDMLLVADDNPLAKAEAEWIAKEMKKPLAARSPPPMTESGTNHAKFFHPTWEGVGAIALAGPRVVIGRRGGFGVAAFDLASGQLAWDTPLTVSKVDKEPRAVTSVGFHDGFVIAQANDRVFFVDASTGAIAGEATVIPLTHAFIAGGYVFGIGPDPVYWGKGGGMAYRLDVAAKSVTPVPGFENVGAVSPSGRLATQLGSESKGNAVRIVEVATGKVLGTLAKSIRHAFRSEETLFVVDDENVAHELAFDGTNLRSFPLGEDMAALPANRRARVAVPYVDPTGRYFVTPRITARKSAVDNTVAVFDAASGACLLKTTPHTPLRGNLDPRYYGDEYSLIEHPAVLRCENELLIGALVRGKDEPLVGTGLTVVSLPPLSAQEIQ